MKLKLFCLVPLFLSIRCGVPDLDALENINAETESKIALPLPGFTYDKLDSFVSLDDYSKSFTKSLKLSSSLGTNITAPEDREIPLIIISEDIIDLSDSNFLATGGKDSQIDEVVFKGGTMELTFKTNLTLKIRISISALEKEGKPYEEEKTLSGDGKTKTFVIPLKGYTLSFTNGVIGVITAKISGKLILKKGEPVSNPFPLIPEFAVKNPKYDIITGYFGQFELDDLDPIDIDLGSVIDSEGAFSFGKTGYVLSLIVENPFGVSFNIDLSDFSFVGSNGNSHPLRKNNGNIFLVPSATLLESGEVLNGKKVVLEFTSENSNIDSVFSKTPEKISIKPVLKINPKGKTSTENFLKTASVIRVSSKAELSLKLKL